MNEYKSRYPIRADIKHYLDQLLAIQWNLSLEYNSPNPDKFKMKQYRAKIFSCTETIGKLIHNIEHNRD